MLLTDICISEVPKKHFFNKNNNKKSRNICAFMAVIPDCCKDALHCVALYKKWLYNRIFYMLYVHGVWFKCRDISSGMGFSSAYFIHTCVCIRNNVYNRKPAKEESAVIIILFILLIAGCILEAYVNPVCMSTVFRRYS